MPARKGWGRGGQLITGNGAASISLSAEFEEPTSFTAQCDVIQNGTAGFVTMTVIWTVNGITITRKIDAAAGATISGMAESVRVIATDSTPAAFPQGVKYNVSVNVSSKPRPTTAVPPILTAVLFETIGSAGGSTGNIPVPPGANSVVVFGANADGTPPTLKVIENATLTTTPAGELPATGSPLLWTSTPVNEYVPLVAGCGYIVIENDGSKNATITVAFGIDG